MSTLHVKSPNNTQKDIDLDGLKLTKTNATGEYYNMPVPEGKVFAEINKIGGKTVAINNQADPMFVYTGSQAIALPKGGSVISGHKYFYSSNFTPNTAGELALYSRKNDVNFDFARISYSNSKIIFTSEHTCISDGINHVVNGHLWIFATSGFQSGETATHTQLIDLTLMFGAGNEPSTVEEFEALCPQEYYQHSLGELISAKVNKVSYRNYNQFNLNNFMTEVMNNDIGHNCNITWLKNGLTLTSTGDDAWTYSYGHYDGPSRFYVEKGKTYYFGGTLNSTGGASTCHIFIYKANNVLADNQNIPNGTGVFATYTATYTGYVSVRFGQLQNGYSSTFTDIYFGELNYYTPYIDDAKLIIPSNIQKLPGYGRSAGTACNFIDFERKIYVQQVGAVDLGTLTWATSSSGTQVRFKSDNNSAVGGVTSTGNNTICSLYTPHQNSGVYSDDSTDKWVVVDANKAVAVKDTSYNNDVSAFKTAMAGVMLYYKLSTPIETDISDILGSTGLVCSTNGILTFETDNDSNYRLAVPVIADFVSEDIGTLTSQDKAKLDTAYNAASSLKLINAPNDILHRTNVTGEYYNLPVPEGKVFSNFNSIGGRTIAWNQLCGSINTFGGVLTNASDCKYIINGTLSLSSIQPFVNSSIIAGHKYYTAIKGYVSGSWPNTIDVLNFTSNDFPVTVQVRANSVSEFTSAIQTSDVNTSLKLHIGPGTYDNVTITAKCIDLTLAFGAGNEPTTTAEVEALFPSETYPYNAGTLLSAGVNKVQSVGVNLLNPLYLEQGGISAAGVNIKNGARVRTINYISVIPNTKYTLSCAGTDIIVYEIHEYDGSKGFIKYTSIGAISTNFTMSSNTYYIRVAYRNSTGAFIVPSEVLTPLVAKGENVAYVPYVIANMPIPPAIQNLPGYGWSAGSARNYVDFINKAYVQNVGKLILDGSESWDYETNNYLAYTGGLDSIEVTPTNQSDILIISDNNKVMVSSWAQRAYTNRHHTLGLMYGQGSIYFKDNSITSGADAKAFFTENPTTIYYPLNTPIITDISDILGTSGIACAEGGTLTFANANGDNYRLPVPVSQDLIDDTDGLMTSQDKSKLETAYEKSQIDYLPTAGGALNGTVIITGSQDVMKRNSVDSGIRIHGGTGQLQGGSLYLFGKDVSSTYEPGGWILRSVSLDGTTYYDLKARNDGRLYWRDRDIITTRGGDLWDNLASSSGGLLNDKNEVKYYCYGTSQEGATNWRIIYKAQLGGDTCHVIDAFIGSGTGRQRDFCGKLVLICFNKQLNSFYSYGDVLDNAKILFRAYITTEGNNTVLIVEYNIQTYDKAFFDGRGVGNLNSYTNPGVRDSIGAISTYTGTTISPTKRS